MLDPLFCRRFSLLSSNTDNFYFDAYNQKRNSRTHWAIFEARDGERTGTAVDALVIGELGDLGFHVPGLPRAPVGTDRNGHPLPQRYFISSPNMRYLPDISKDTRFVYVREDGRYGTGDFTILSQWFSVSTAYLSVLRRRPTSPLGEHPLGDIWYDLKPQDFEYEESSGDRKIGRIKKSITDRFRKLSEELRSKAKEFLSKDPYSSFDISNLQHCMESLTFSLVILETATQTFQLTLMNVTGFQRDYLEVLALYEYLTIYKHKPASQLPVVDETLMGTVTFSLEVAQMMYSKGIPVWLVRSPDHFSSKTKIVATTIPTVPHDALRTAMAYSQPVYKGEASAIRNRACQALKAGNIRHGHSAYSIIPGDFSLERCIRVPLNQIYAHPLSGPLNMSSSSSTSVSSSSSSSTSVSSSSSSSTSVSSSSSSSTSASSSSPHVRSSGSIRTSPSSLTSVSSSSFPMVASFNDIPPAREFKSIVCMRNVNKDKFRSPFFNDRPLVTVGWQTALESVDLQWRRIKNHPNTNLLKGYPFLDPYPLLNNPSDGNRIKTYLVSWCAIRAAWIARVTDYTRDQVFPESQDWKQFLIDDVAAALQFLSRGPTNSKRMKKRLEKCDVDSLAEIFALDLSNVRSTLTIMWRDVVLAKAGNRNVDNLHLPDFIFREVIWDLFESNFRIEMLCLDRSIFPRHEIGLVWSSRRDTMVAACFPRNTFFNHDYPVSDEGLGAAQWQDRLVYVEALRLLLASWPGYGARVLKRKEPLTSRRSNQQEVADVEGVAFAFYCQTFFDYFGRAPTIPCIRQ